MRRTVPFMHFQQWNGAIVAVWIVTGGIVGLVGDITSVFGAVTVLGVGLVPPVLLTLHWSTGAAPVRTRQIH
jgi:hypothetical protein